MKYLVEAACYSAEVPLGCGIEYVGPSDTNEEFEVEVINAEQAAQKIINHCDIDPLQLIAVTPAKGSWLHRKAVTFWRPIDGIAIKDED